VRRGAYEGEGVEDGEIVEEGVAEGEDDEHDEGLGEGVDFLHVHAQTVAVHQREGRHEADVDQQHEDELVADLRERAVPSSQPRKICGLSSIARSGTRSEAPGCTALPT
jgi:hypothetical protein